MTAGLAIAASLLRAALVAAFWFLMVPAVARLPRGRWRRLAFLPILVPGLMVGYVVRSDTLAWALGWRELVLFGLLVAITLPLAMLAAQFAPPTATARSLATWRMATDQPNWTLRLAAARPRVAAACAAFLWTFQEAELTILLQGTGWSEWAQRQLIGGRGVDLIAELWPAAAIQIAAVALGWRLLSQSQRLASWQSTSASPTAPVTARLLIAAAVGATLVYPACSLAIETVGGASALFVQPGLWRVLGWTIVFAAMAAMVARSLVRRLRPLAAAPLIAAGATGPLLVAILIQAATAATLPTLLRGPLPHLLAVVLSIVPKAAVLMVVADAACDRRAIAAAEWAGCRRAIWQNRDRPPGMAFAILFWAAYFEVMVASVLAAPGMETTPVQLYSLVHFGQIRTLAAWLVLAAAAPLLVAFVGLVGSRLPPFSRG